MKYERVLRSAIFLAAALLIIVGIVAAQTKSQEKPKETNDISRLRDPMVQMYADKGFPAAAGMFAPKTIEEDSDVPKRMVLIPAGEFLMGSPDGEGGGNEHPQHKVWVDDFLIDRYEVTNLEYEKFDPSHRAKGREWSESNDDPVVWVSWWDAIKYCNWLSHEEGLEPCYDEETGKCDFTKKGYRLPTGAEWEKAARGTDGRKYPWGNEAPNAGGKYRCNYSPGRDDADDGYHNTAPVGSYERGKSPYGLYDMAGNVWEWCNDWLKDDYYKNSPYRNPRGPDNGRLRVKRGGAYAGNIGDLRTATRYSYFGPDRPTPRTGFRCARTP